MDSIVCRVSCTSSSSRPYPIQCVSFNCTFCSLQHFVLSKTPTLRASAYDAANTILYFVYASLVTVAHDFELGPVEAVHFIDTFADRKSQLCALVESSRGALEDDWSRHAVFIVEKWGTEETRKRSADVNSGTLTASRTVRMTNASDNDRKLSRIHFSL